MVVDDLLIMCKVIGCIFECYNFEVSVVCDGVEVLEWLEECVLDLMLLDIEMLCMDGYELVIVMCVDFCYRDVLIVMIILCSGDKYCQCVFEIGVQCYLGKLYQELDLMCNVYDLLGIVCVCE